LSVEPTADADTIKKAFRREIARYHPDKVVHLGPEFQEMAATRAAELTVAYKTLSDPVLRAQYDAGAVGFAPPPGAGAESAPPPPPPTPEAHEPPPPGKRRFETERAGRDVIVRRAITARVRGIVESLFGPVESPDVRGFDTAFVPVAKPRFLGSHPPRVLLKMCEAADASAIAEAWSAASRSKVHAGKSPVVVLLCGGQLAPARELREALDGTARQRQAPDGPREMVIVVVNIGDWTCHTQDVLPATVRKLIDRICE
jgi:hypothetical protein